MAKDSQKRSVVIPAPKIDGTREPEAGDGRPSGARALHQTLAAALQQAEAALEADRVTEPAPPIKDKPAEAAKVTPAATAPGFWSLNIRRSLKIAAAFGARRDLRCTALGSACCRPRASKPW